MPRCQKQTLCSALFLSHGDLSSAKDNLPSSKFSQGELLVSDGQDGFELHGTSYSSILGFHWRNALNQDNQDQPFLVLVTSFFIPQPSC